jgi:stearoyl-CoA desaturase (delta-9 desaturase)
MFALAVELAAHGVAHAAWWQIVLYTLVTTHVTIAAVTIFLHRSQAHRALELSAIPSHFFRFWLWIGTGMVTKEWVAIHRKHHARCETQEDPHSPQTRGLRKVLLQGAELYRAESRNAETIAAFGHNTPDDWIERHVYSRFQWQGVGALLVFDVVMFGAIGATVWAVQMLWIPVLAAGVINGIGHFWGYRNFEATDASRNVFPWGILIGGEELHNNHHTYPTSAKLSVKSYEFDIAWGYIRALEMVGLARVRKVPPRLRLGDLRPAVDAQTLEALIAHRHELMSSYSQHVRTACREEISGLRAQGGGNSHRLRRLAMASKWLHRDAERIPHHLRSEVEETASESTVLAKMLSMREELRAIWTRTYASTSHAVSDLQTWCDQAERSGIEALQEFSRTLRAVRT